MQAPSCIIGISVRSAAEALSSGLNFAGYGSICEGCSLVIVLISFLAAGVLCIRRFYKGTTDRSTEVGRKNSKVQRQIIVTVSTVFTTFLLRSVYAAALAASRRGRIITPFDANSRCSSGGVSGSFFCDTCQELGVIVQTWLYLIPVFSFTVFSLSSPVTILVALWGMTTGRILQSFKSIFRQNRQTASCRESMRSLVKD